MDVLLNIEQQLARVIDAIAVPGTTHASQVPSPSTMTPVLIHIEQLLDKIRSATRAIVAEASQQRTEDLTATKAAEFDDFRIKLETEDIVDYESETETEDEAPVEQEKEKGDEHKRVSGLIGVKRSRENEEEKEQEPALKRQERASTSKSNTENRLGDNLARLLQQARKCLELSEEAAVQTVWKAITKLMHLSSLSLNGMVSLIQDGGAIGQAIAVDFRDAVLLLPSIIERHQKKRKVSQSWIAGISKSIAEVVAHAKDNSDVPACLADPQLEATSQNLTEIRDSSGPDLLRKMENLIYHLTRKDVLEPDRMEKPLGKLASIFRKDMQTCKKKKTPRTDEDWGRFYRIAEILAEWIRLAERASEPPELRPHLRRFDRQIKGFVKKNPGRIPPTLLEGSVILVGFATPTNVNKEEEVGSR
ncbi:hypothetical protein GN958_ATG18276 [Phytophthora infestans]|uniref:Uncharacterized protein n=2 Tax=Phytophthora infestans TaxID=4787 RepID=A0A8S9TUS5_PHYIN|nr:hypothetical protein GN958_ATG18276 [Phytophthora infestans]